MPAAPDRQLVALRLPPGQEFIDALDEAWAAGNAVLPIEPSIDDDAAERLLAAMRPDLPIDDGVALVIATSGSTGEPKGAELTHAALEASIAACHTRIGVEPDDVWLSCLPWQHIGGIQVMLRAWLLGIPLVVHERFDEQRVAESPATLTSVVPTQLVRLLDADVDLSKFRVILLGGAAAPQQLLDRAQAAGANIVTTYGMSETCGGCVYDGHPLDGVEVETDADGRLRIRGPMLMRGYRGRPDLAAEVLVDGWLRTSDRGEIAADGSLRVVGRVDDVIITGGENVAADRVADVLRGHPEIADAVVLGVTDPTWGQRVVAIVVPAEGQPPPSLEDLRDWCDPALRPPERPRQLLVVDALPQLPSGKIDRLALQRMAGELGDDRV
jgi:O-succinylbenzoic acid--CoA ligase